MKFIFLLITTVSVFGSCLFGILINTTEKDITEIKEKLNTSTVSAGMAVKGKKELSNELVAEFIDKRDNFPKVLEKKQAEYKVWEIEYLKKFGMDIYKSNPTAFLTYDDGPNSLTPQFLDLLKDKGVKATFFISANSLVESAERRADVKRMVQEGHVAAIHTFSHDYETIYSTKEAFFEDFEKAEKLITEAGGVKPTLVRLPSGTATAKTFCKKYGKSDTLFSEIITEIEARGYTISDWNIDTNDWKSSTTPASIAAGVKIDAQNQLKHKYKAALILMHNKQKSLEATGEIIDNLKAIGYNFEPMTQYGYAFLQATK